ncbi:unnamed protein product, partial [Timema podura]|uniref:Uncharacterized protein n=2 Tax=Timema TaxID=61471 RepID=A0A7R9FB77_9NEOP|nr:unnamed protein product [Timema bartmani]CAG2067477.1 unnamed protein product [Timema podura]
MLQLEKLAGRNFLRVFRRVEKVKQDLRRLAVEAYEDWIPPSDLKDLNKYGCIGR